jgi:hypothetical protein
VVQPHVRNRGRADDLIRVHGHGARGSTDPGSFQSLQSHVPRYDQYRHDANGRDRGNLRDRDVERLYDRSLAYGCANLPR